jgi:hypothetical protein
MDWGVLGDGGVRTERGGRLTAAQPEVKGCRGDVEANRSLGIGKGRPIDSRRLSGPDGRWKYGREGEKLLTNPASLAFSVVGYFATT